jgi:peptidyl-prolyl cis-trans isomerase D
MLQSLRDNLKGTIAVIVIAIFAVPMVLFGVEKLFVGSLGGNDVATVDGTSISRTELSRAIYLQKQRILSETNVDPSSEFLKDENLRGPVLESLTRQLALVNAAKEGGMAVSEAALWQEIMQQPQFQTDGVFDRQRFRQFVNNLGYTTATYLEALADGVVVNQQQDGIVSSSFITEQDLQQFVALAQQSRSYFQITVPASEVKDAIDVSDQEIGQYYEQNQNRFRVPEQVALNYIEVDLDTLAKRQEVDEADVRDQYEQEMASFDAAPQYEISHILIEGEEGAKEKVQAVQEALASGQDFAEVAQQYSEDLGTRESGGYLGQLMPDVYPEPLVEAVRGLEEGEISDPIETEAGTHIVRVDRKTVPTTPTFAERKAEIEDRLRRSLAEQQLGGLRDRLDELTYSASDLQQAAEALNLEVKSTQLSPRNGGQGILRYPAVQEAAFSAEVLEEGHNSPVIELPDNRLVVVRATAHEPARVRPLDEVRDQVAKAVLAEKAEQALADKAQEIAAKVKQEADAAQVAESEGYAYKEADKISRSNTDANPAVVDRLFSMPRPAGEAPVVDTVALPNGDYVVLGLTEVVPGSLESLEKPQREAMRAQLAQRMGVFEAASYVNQIVSSADIEM